MVKYTETILQYTKSMIFFGKRLKVVAKCCLDLIFLHGVLYCYARYSNIEYQDEIFKSYH